MKDNEMYIKYEALLNKQNICEKELDAKSEKVCYISIFLLRFKKLVCYNKMLLFRFNTWKE